MSGPCLCGDPYCPSCGSSRAAELEAAERDAMDKLSDAQLSPAEYRIVVVVGLSAVEEMRKLMAELQQEGQQDSYADLESF